MTARCAAAYAAAHAFNEEARRSEPETMLHGECIGAVGKQSGYGHEVVHNT